MNPERLYLAMPLPLQNLLVSCEGWSIVHSRYNARFRRFLAEYGDRTLWDAGQVESFRNRRLRDFVAHAARTVPHYRDLFAKLRLRAEEFCSLADLQQLPILTKQEVQESPERFMSEAVPRRARRVCHTSGSTGAGLRFAATADCQREQWAVWWRYRQCHGLTHHTPCLYLGGRSVVPLTQRRPPFWRHNRPGRQILFSAYHLGPETAESYLRAMKSSGAAWMHGYPSLVSLVAHYALEWGIRPSLRWVTTGAENLLPQQIQLIERAFGVRPIQHYGMAEGVANVSQCPRGNLHVDEDFAAVEFVAHPAGGFRILGTNFTNPAFPLLRYDTGDVAAPVGRPVVAAGQEGSSTSSTAARKTMWLPEARPNRTTRPHLQGQRERPRSANPPIASGQHGCLRGEGTALHTARRVPARRRNPETSG